MRVVNTETSMPWTDQERETFRFLAARLRREGWRSDVTPEYLLAKWERLATRCRDYPLGVEDYLNDVSVRRGLELLLEWTRGTPLHEKLASEVERTDDLFRSNTVDDGGAFIDRNSKSRGEEWWRKRRPVGGRYL